MNASDRAFGQWMFLIYATDTVLKLMSGNDTCCFTTEQFARAHSENVYEREPDPQYKEAGIRLGLQVPAEIRRNQLRAIPGVREVKLDLWTYEPTGT